MNIIELAMTLVVGFSILFWVSLFSLKAFHNLMLHKHDTKKLNELDKDLSDLNRVINNLTAEERRKVVENFCKKHNIQIPVIKQSNPQNPKIEKLRNQANGERKLGNLETAKLYEAKIKELELKGSK